MHCFSPEVLSLLSASGWSAGRKIDVDFQVSAISRTGFCATSYTMELISEFQGVRIVSNNKRLCFDALLALGQIEHGDVPYIKKLLSDNTCPIGYEEAGSLILFSSDPNRLFGLNREWLAGWSFTSIEGMLEYLFFSGSQGFEVKIDDSQLPPSFRD